jgi:nitrogen regulatory protein PII
VKLVTMIFDSGFEEEMRGVIDKLGFEGVTCVCKATGRGRTGPREGTTIWPGTNSIFLILTEDERVAPLVDELKRFRSEQEKSFPVGLKVFASDAEDLL